MLWLLSIVQLQRKRVASYTWMKLADQNQGIKRRKERKKESMLMTTSNSEREEMEYWYRGWMRVTLTKHRGHGVKPLSHENKEILSSFVRRYPYLSVWPVFSFFPDFYLLSLFSSSFTYFYLRLFATVRIIAPPLSPYTPAIICIPVHASDPGSCS